MRDRVTIQLMNPRGWIYVTEYEDGRWGWEARLGGLGLDAGMARTEEEGLAKARAAVKHELGHYPSEVST